MHPLEQQYNSLNTILAPLALDSPSYTTLAKMVAVETESERGLWRLELVDGFAVERAGEGAFECEGERKVLWYGAQGQYLVDQRPSALEGSISLGMPALTRLVSWVAATHWAGLVSQGLSKAEGGPRSGRKFRQGVRRLE